MIKTTLMTAREAATELNLPVGNLFILSYRKRIPYFFNGEGYVMFKKEDIIRLQEGGLI